MDDIALRCGSATVNEPRASRLADALTNGTASASSSSPRKRLPPLLQRRGGCGNSVNGPAGATVRRAETTWTIIKGAKPRPPIEQQTKFEMIINEDAKALGPTIRVGAGRR